MNKRYSGHKVSLWDKPAEQFKDFYFLEKSLEFLRGTGEEPFALFTYLWAPHPPFRIPEPYAGMYKPEDIINYMRDLSLDDVAKAVFLSSGYLSIIFKDETGYTVLEYITYVRMQKAKGLLLQTPALKVKDIAEQLGYNNVQSFLRYFKKYYGETPMAFRKKEE